MKALNFARRLWNDEEGATAIEYGLLAALVAVALITVLGTMSGELEATFQNVQDERARRRRRDSRLPSSRHLGSGRSI